MFHLVTGVRFRIRFQRVLPVGLLVPRFWSSNYHPRGNYRKIAMAEKSSEVPSVLPKLSAGDFKAFNGMAVHMDYFVRYILPSISKASMLTVTTA